MDYYTQLFAAEPVDVFSQRQLFSYLTVKVSDLERDSGEGSSPLPETSAAAKSLSLNKYPGPDGFALEFYLHFWDLLGPLLVNRDLKIEVFRHFPRTANVKKSRDQSLAVRFAV